MNMKIYTKTGDSGETSLLGGERVFKDCITMKVVGELDELNAALGIVRSQGKINNLDREIESQIDKIQKNLFLFGAEVAAVQMSASSKYAGDKISESDILELEKSIDEMTAKIPELKNFILPGGATVAAHLHLARTICRRAERELVAMGKIASVRGQLYQYLNRLSDWIFVSARWVNFTSNYPEEIIK